MPCISYLSNVLQVQIAQRITERFVGTQAERLRSAKWHRFQAKVAPKTRS